MEKRRKTMDRWQRLGFGRRSTSNPPDAEQAAASTNTKKGQEKTERLKELTEMLRGSRAPQMPPIPPPRKPRSPNNTLPDSCSLKDESDYAAASKIISLKPKPTEQKHLFHGPIRAIKSLRANTSASNLEEHLSDELEEMDIPTSLPPPIDVDFTAPLAKAEARTVISASTQKHIPFRSASFSQVDYSSGKYIRSALGAIKTKLTKNKEASVVDSANLTLPRKKEGSSPTKSDTEDDRLDPNGDRVKTELNISLAYESDRISLASELATVEPLSPIENTTPNNGCFDVDRFVADTEDTMNGFILVKASEMTLDTLEEELSIDSPQPKEEFLQTATTCLIPVPVYECVTKDWSCPDSTEQWLDASENDNAKEERSHQNDIVEVPADIDNIPQILQEDCNLIEHFETHNWDELPEIKTSFDDDRKVDINDCDDNLPNIASMMLIDGPSEEIKNPKLERSHTWSPSNDVLPAISVTSGSVSELDDNSQRGDGFQSNTEHVEVRKRHSNEDRFDKPMENMLNSLDADYLCQNSKNEDRKRIDKSKRRKGIYIQWPVVEKDKCSSDKWDNTQEMNAQTGGNSTPMWRCDDVEIEMVADNTREIDLQNCDFLSLDVNKNGDSPAISENIFLMCRSAEGSPTPASVVGSFEPTTPESDSNRPIWPRLSRRQSLTCQSSEEKDDQPLTASPSIKSFQKLNFLRSDSISDNESDRTPPRERSSQSPAPSEQDLKRYSKRPLRGPYGQMLEAEMKKPPKHYDEIIEEFNRPDR